MSKLNTILKQFFLLIKTKPTDSWKSPERKKTEKVLICFWKKFQVSNFEEQNICL